jgi:hypothetical protein
VAEEWKTVMLTVLAAEERKAATSFPGQPKKQLQCCLELGDFSVSY